MNRFNGEDGKQDFFLPHWLNFKTNDLRFRSWEKRNSPEWNLVQRSDETASLPSRASWPWCLPTVLFPPNFSLCTISWPSTMIKIKMRAMRKDSEIQANCLMNLQWPVPPNSLCRIWPFYQCLEISEPFNISEWKKDPETKILKGETRQLPFPWAFLQTSVNTVGQVQVVESSSTAPWSTGFWCLVYMPGCVCICVPSTSAFLILFLHPLEEV